MGKVGVFAAADCRLLQPTVLPVRGGTLVRGRWRGKRGDRGRTGRWVTTTAREGKEGKGVRLGKWKGKRGWMMKGEKRLLDRRGESKTLQTDATNSSLYIWLSLTNTD